MKIVIPILLHKNTNFIPILFNNCYFLFILVFAFYLNYIKSFCFFFYFIILINNKCYIIIKYYYLN